MSEEIQLSCALTNVVDVFIEGCGVAFVERKTLSSLLWFADWFKPVGFEHQRLKITLLGGHVWQNHRGQRLPQLQYSTTQSEFHMVIESWGCTRFEKVFVQQLFYL